VPTPPLAITSIDTARASAAVASTLGPRWVPSRATSVYSSAAAPQRSARWPSSIAVTSPLVVQPSIATTPSRASTAMTTLPGCARHTSSTSAGERTAAVPSTTWGRAGGQHRFDRGAVADAAAHLDRHRAGGDDLGHQRQLRRCAGERAVEIHQVQPRDARHDQLVDQPRRILVVRGRAIAPALVEADGHAAEQIDRGEHTHAPHFTMAARRPPGDAGDDVSAALGAVPISNGRRAQAVRGDTAHARSAATSVAGAT
jgi:hypothetical protein